MEAAAEGKPVHFLFHYILEKMIETIKQSTIKMKSFSGDKECPEYKTLMKFYVEELNGSARVVTGNVLTEKLKYTYTNVLKEYIKILYSKASLVEQSASGNQFIPKQDDDTQFKSTNHAQEMNTTSETLGDKVDNMKIFDSEQTISQEEQKDVQGTYVKDEDENRCKGNLRPIIIDGCNIAFQHGSR